MYYLEFLSGLLHDTWDDLQQHINFCASNGWWSKTLSVLVFDTLKEKDGHFFFEGGFLIYY